MFNNIFSEKYHEALFISSGGNTELDQRSEIALAVLSKVLSGIQIFVLKDRDISSGKATSQDERTLYLKNNPSNHRVLKRWEIENYLFDKEVLKKYCNANACNFDGTAYEGFVTNIEDQNLKDETSKIKNFCGINTNVNVEKFKLELSECISDDMAVYSAMEDCIFK